VGFCYVSSVSEEGYMQAKPAADGAFEGEDIEKWNLIAGLTNQGRRMDAPGF
jgi:hypothetical protein